MFTIIKDGVLNYTLWSSAAISHYTSEENLHQLLSLPYIEVSLINLSCILPSVSKGGQGKKMLLLTVKHSPRTLMNSIKTALEEFIVRKFIANS